MLNRFVFCLLFALPSFVRSQVTEVAIPKNFGRIVELAVPSGALDHFHNLIGYDSTGLVKQASHENTYTIFGNTPNTTDLNAGLNNANKFGAPGGSDCYEIRYGSDSSRYWINSALAPNQLPFAFYHVGPKSASNPSITGGVKLCIRVQDDDANGIYTPGEKINVYGDLTLPFDSVYADSISLKPSFPYLLSNRYLGSLRTGLSSVSYNASSFVLATDGAIPPHGTVIRLVAQTADTSLPFVYAQDSIVTFTNRRYAYPFSYYSYETPMIQLINAPAGMSLNGDSIIWMVDPAQLGNEYSVILQMTNGIGTTQKPFTAKAHAIYPQVQTVCASIHPDSIYNAIGHLQNMVTRFAIAPNRRDVAERIKNKFIQIGYPTARLDSFYLTNLQWPFNSGVYYPQWNYNVIAELPGAVEPDSVYILGGHHDAILYPYSMGDPFVSAPGADDNASGTVAAIEVARVFKKFNYQPKHTIKFMTFATEEFGLFGSKDYALKARTSNERIQMMINNDMIATCQDTVNFWRMNLLAYSNSDNVTQLAKRAVEQYTTLKGYDVSVSNSSGSDSRPFYDQEYKTIFLQEDQFSPFYHSTNDLLANCNIPYMAELVKVSCAMLMMENGTDITINAKEEEKPVYSFELAQNYPNPFNPSTTIRYTLSESGKVSLKIYNTLGQEVRALVNAAQNAGQQTVKWDGKNNSGQAVGSGVYLYRLECGKFSKTHKMMLVR